jgi:hypothetical protein
MKNLGQETGGTHDERVTEAHQLLKMIADHFEELSPKEQKFIEDMQDCTSCSGRQLFWLRDIKDGLL